jgi:hypothetical protein
MSRTVSYDEWLQHGIYPAGSPGADAGKPFNPSDPNLRSYYNNYVSAWNSAEPALRIAINNQHGLGFANESSGGEGGEGGGGSGGGSSGLGPVFTPLDLSAPNQNDYFSYYPQSYMPADPAYPTMGLLSQPYGNNVDVYQPWSQQYGNALVADSLWNYNPPALPASPASFFAIPVGSYEDGEEESPASSSGSTEMTPEEMKEAGLLDGTGGAVGGAASDPGGLGSGLAGPGGVDSPGFGW